MLEVGCGLALASLVCHRRGIDVTASDCHPLASRFLLDNLRLNGLPSLPGELCCYDDFMAAVERRTDWHNRGMRNELHALRTRLETALTSGA